VYAVIVQAIDAAAAAEMKRRGAGVACILKELVARFN
jgi:hypothetical protein